MLSLKRLPLPGGKDAWQTATSIFLISRLLILTCTYIGRSRFFMAGQKPHDCWRYFNSCLQSWDYFDARYFLGIAHNGYGRYANYTGYNPHHPYAAAFFPLYPLLIHAVGSLFGGSLLADYLAALLLANLCFFLALVLLYCFVRNDFDHSIAQQSLFFLALSPFGVFFFLGYSESLFLLLSLAALLLLRRGRPLDWWLAGLCSLGAILTRGTGIILLLSFLVAFFQHFRPALHAIREKGASFLTGGCWRPMLNALLPMGLIPLALAGYMLYLWLNWHDPLLFSHGEEHLWGRQLTWPWVGIIGALWELLYTASGRDVRNLTDLLFTLLPLIILIRGWRRLPLDYLVFSLAIALFSLMYPWPGHTLAATPRFLLLMFPVGVALALWSGQSMLRKALEIFWVAFFVINTLLFVLGSWVA